LNQSPNQVSNTRPAARAWRWLAVAVLIIVVQALIGGTLQRVAMERAGVFDQPAPATVTATTFAGGFRIVGAFDKPLGRRTVLVGRVIRAPALIEGKMRVPFEVISVDGRACAPHQIMMGGTVNSDLQLVPPLDAGVEYEVVGWETGAFVAPQTRSPNSESGPGMPHQIETYFWLWSREPLKAGG